MKTIFPPQETADGDGVLAISRSLNREMLRDAYCHGIFPWPYEEDSVLWFAPPMRAVLPLDRIHVHVRLKRALRKTRFRFAVSKNFNAVIDACSEVPRPGQDGTWITSAIKREYKKFHELGFAQSFETYDENGDLVGGMYGVSVGGLFCGESMFHRKSDASKFALLSACSTLKRCGVRLLDTQVKTPLLESFGAFEIPRPEFLKQLKKLAAPPLSLKELNEHLGTPEDFF